MTAIASAISRNRLHVVICSMAAVWGWASLTGTPLLPEDLFIVPMAMASIYLWNRVCDTREDSLNVPQDALKAIEAKRGITATCMICAAAGMAIGLVRGEKWASLLILLVLSLGFFYSTPVRSSGRRLKNLFLTKNLVSSFGWAVLTVIYPVAHAGVTFTLEHALVFAAMFVAVWTVEIFWDIRDVVGDRIAAVNTIPVLLGVGVARVWIVVINLACLCAVLYGSSTGNLSIWWFLVTANSTLAVVFAYCGTQLIQRRRAWSDTLVVFQTVLLLWMGFIPTWSSMG